MSRSKRLCLGGSATRYCSAHYMASIRHSRCHWIDSYLDICARPMRQHVPVQPCHDMTAQFVGIMFARDPKSPPKQIPVNVKLLLPPRHSRGNSHDIRMSPLSPQLHLAASCVCVIRCGPWDPYRIPRRWSGVFFGAWKRCALRLRRLKAARAGLLRIV